MSNGEEITEFAESLRRLKDRSGRSYGALAAKLHVSTSTLHRYCNGDAVPAEYAAVERFARQCGASPEELIALHRRWILADAARRSASGRGGTVQATAPDGASGRAAARRGSAARVGAPNTAEQTAGPPVPAGQATHAHEKDGQNANTHEAGPTAKRGPATPTADTPKAAGQITGPPTPAGQATGARETVGRTADAREAGRDADPRHHPAQAAHTPDPAEHNAAGLTADRHDAAGRAAVEGGDEERRSAADAHGEPRGAKRPRAADGPADSSANPAGRGPSSPAQPDHRAPAPSAAQARGSVGPDVTPPSAPFAPAGSLAAAPRDGDRPIAGEGGPGPAGSGAARAGSAGAVGRGPDGETDDATGVGGPSAADTAVSDEPGPRAGRDTAATRESEARAQATAADPSRVRTSEAGGATKDATVAGDASERRTAGVFAAEGAVGSGHDAGVRGGGGPSADGQRARAGGGRSAVGGDAARTGRQGGRAPDGPGGRAGGSAGRAKGAAGRGPLRSVPAEDGAWRRSVGLGAWRSRPWGMVLGAAAAAVLAFTAVEVRSTTGGEQEDAATSPSSPSSPGPSATASGSAPSTRPTTRGELKKDDTADGRASSSPRGGERRGGASASASPGQGGSSGGGSGGGRDDKPGSGTPLTVSTRSHVWENGCGHRYLIDRPPSQVAPPPVEQDAAAWASAHSAVHGGTTNVEMTVKGRSESAVVLQALHVRVVGRRAPLPWSSFAMDNGCGGSLTPRAFSVNLDAARPLAIPTDGNDAGEPIPAVRFPYRVSDTDPEVLLVNARTSGCDCSWYLELDWTSGDREGTIRIDDHGAPFRTSSVKGRPEYGYQFEEQGWRRND